MPITLAELAERIDAELLGDGSGYITGLAAIEDALPGDLSFVTSSRYVDAARRSRAGALVVGLDWKGSAPCALLKTENPDKAFARAAQILVPTQGYPPGIHPSAFIAEDACIGEDVYVGPGCVVDAGASIGARSVIRALCYVGTNAVIGADCTLHPSVNVLDRCIVGDRSILHSGAVVGSDGFGYTWDDGTWGKIPQIGIVEIGCDVELGANVCVDRARFGRTVIEDGVKVDNLVQIAHNVRVGAHTAMAAQAGISGSTMIGRGVRVGGQAGIAGHLNVGDGAVLSAQAGVLRDIPPGTHALGAPALPKSKMWRIQGALLRLPELKDKVKHMEARLKALENGETRAVAEPDNTKQGADA